MNIFLKDCQRKGIAKVLCKVCKVSIAKDVKKTTLQNGSPPIRKQKVHP